MKECISMYAELSQVSVSFVHRQCNGVADVLAKFARTNNCNQSWVLVPPIDDILNHLIKDKVIAMECSPITDS